MGAPANDSLADDGVLSFAEVFAAHGQGPDVVGPVTGQVHRGEVVALVGPNGAGKSSLLHAAVGGTVRTRGRIHLCGRALEPRPGSAAAMWRARRLALVPQAGGVRFGFTVAEVLAMGRHPHADANAPCGRAAIAAAIAACDLEALLPRPCRELSGGQQRRVLLARAIAQAQGGAVLLADEPTSGVDPGRADAAMATLRNAATQGLAVMVTVHDLTAAWRYADRVWLLHRGRIVAAGPAEAVLRREVLEPVYGVGFGHQAGEALPGALRGGSLATAPAASRLCP